MGTRAKVLEDMLNTSILESNTELQKSFDDKITILKNELKNEIHKSLENIKSTIINQLSKENKRLRERVHILESETDDLYEKMYYFECSVQGANQHNRKNNIEISGLPDEIEDDILESAF